MTNYRTSCSNINVIDLCTVQLHIVLTFLLQQLLCDTVFTLTFYVFPMEDICVRCYTTTYLVCIKKIYPHYSKNYSLFTNNEHRFQIKSLLYSLSAMLPPAIPGDDVKPPRSTNLNGGKIILSLGGNWRTTTRTQRFYKLPHLQSNCFVFCGHCKEERKNNLSRVPSSL
jgi:hypothetical protein